MFEYTVYGYDYNLGGFDMTFEYQGVDRAKALHTYRDAKAWMGHATIKCRLLGRKEENVESFCAPAPLKSKWSSEEYSKLLASIDIDLHACLEEDDDLPF